MVCSVKIVNKFIKVLVKVVNCFNLLLSLVVNSFMSDLIAKGGRGNKAPYETTLVRVPLTVKPLVEKLTAAYRRCFEVSSDDLSIALGEMLERVEVAIGQSAVPGAERLCQEKAIATPQEKPVNKIDPHEVRDRYLASLRLGKQAPEYKRAKQHIDAFIKELEKAEARS
ncbi:hypothetical protein NIES4073_03780 (plasmid) [Kalymmatonema gypsitolerans NIES-4073]|nr:hypothetical protein NIES4073_03780 [Scytonema sp. NIES-4073]